MLVAFMQLKSIKPTPLTNHIADDLLTWRASRSRTIFAIGATKVLLVYKRWIILCFNGSKGVTVWTKTPFPNSVSKYNKTRPGPICKMYNLASKMGLILWFNS